MNRRNGSCSCCGIFSSLHQMGFCSTCFKAAINRHCIQCGHVCRIYFVGHSIERFVESGGVCECCYWNAYAVARADAAAKVKADTDAKTKTGADA